MYAQVVAGLHTAIDAEEAGAGTPLVVGLHGMGSHEWALVQAYRSLGEDLALAFPRGPLQHVPGYAWYTLAGPGVPDPASFRQGLATIGAWLAEVRALPELAGRPVYLSGFSHGAAMALSYALLHPEGLAGVLSFSGYLPDAVRPAAAPGLRAFLALGAQDRLMAVDLLEATAARVRAGGVEPTVLLHEGGHDIPVSALDAARAWLTPR